MVFQKGQVTNPEGNPNIKDAPKTGPKSIAGKWKSVIYAGNITNGRHSKLLKQIRRCDICPLRPKEVVIRGQIVMSYPRCSQYSPNPEHSCPVGELDFIARSKLYFEILEKYDVNELMVNIALEQQARSQIAEQMEMMEHGRPGQQSLEFSKSAADILDKVQKNTGGEKHVNVDMTQELLHKMFPMDDEDEEN